MKQNQFVKRAFSTLVLTLMLALTASAQQGIQVSGTVVDDNGDPVIGASVILEGKSGVGTITDFDGNFHLTVPNQNSEIVISYVGMITQKVKVGSKRDFNIVLKEDAAQLNEVVVVGYGQQKKASVVGSIAQTDAKTLERYSNLPTLGAALTGNLPGVVTSASTGLPGDEDPKITIRGNATLGGNADPLILVDGVERPMNTVDIGSVQSISVLKDASATAVYGVKGANGVILITTKRGQEGKAQVHVKANSTLKVVSKLPEKYDSYDTFIIKDDVIQRESPISTGSWGSFKDMETINKYRYPANSAEWDRYPNVDWQDELFNKSAMSYNVTADVSGGTKSVRYFAAIDFTHEGDIFKEFENNRGYTSGFGYNRINLRSNLDFDITKTTQFTLNLFGSNGVRRYPYGHSAGSDAYWGGIYRTAPDAFRAINTDGSYGFYAPRDADQPNSVASLAYAGDERATNTQITTDFILKQDLAFITQGLKFSARLSYDNTMMETGRGINDMYHEPFYEYINPESGDISYNSRWNQTEDYPYQQQVLWTTTSGSVNKGATYRKLYYSLQLDYARQFGEHEVTALGLFSRDTYATGAVFPHYREDWVFRLTYNYATRYFAEINGAYNGSEQWGSNNRFKFFPSISLGWMISEESFVKKYVGKFLDMLKIRASYGKVGDDNTVSDRWLYRDIIEHPGNYWKQTPGMDDASPYQQYTIARLGNPDIKWETVTKKNLGFDYSFLGGLIAGSFDIFSDKRTDVVVAGANRAVPSYFGMNAPYANVGVIKNHGWELTVRLNHVFPNKLRLWANCNITHAVNKVDFADDPALKPAYQKTAGFSIGQTKTFLDSGFLNTWDDIIGETSRMTYDNNVLPGDYRIIDFNADGIIDQDDQAPYKYTGTPENTYSATIGAEWKGFSLTCQFYGVNNVTRYIGFPSFYGATNSLFKEGSYYYASTGSGEIPLPRWTTEDGYGSEGTRYYYDGSYVRLKNAELAYTFTQNWLKKVGLNTLKIYLSGDNLILWTDMPDDRESNFSGAGNMGAYPTVRRFNLGIDLNF